MKEDKFKKILKSELEIPKQVEDKMQEAYKRIGADEKSERKHAKGYHRWISVAAAVVLFALVPMGVYATGAVFYKMIKQNGSLLEYELKVNYDMTPYDIEVVPGYMPEGYEMKEDGPWVGKIHNDANGGGITIMTHNAADLDEMEDFKFYGVKDVEKTKIQGMEAHVITSEWQNQLIRDIVLFNEEDGYVVIVWSDGEELSTEELKKVAEDMKITKLDTQIVYKSRQEKQDEKNRQERQEQTNAELREIGIPKDMIYAVGEEMSDPMFKKDSKYHADIRFTVESIEVKDILPEDEFAKKQFTRYEEEVAPWLNEDGTLKSHIRYKDVFDETGEVVDSKFVVVKMKACNLKESESGIELGDHGAQLAPHLKVYKTRKDGSLGYFNRDDLGEEGYSLQSDGFPIYFDEAVHTEGTEVKAFACRPLPEGEEIVYTLVYVVDDDRIEDAYLQMYNVGGADANCTYVKITK